MSDIDLIIDVGGGDDSDLMDFLRQHGVHVRPHYGVHNGPLPDMTEALKHPAPYIWATATASVLIAAIKAYSDTKKKRLIVSRLKTGVKVDATNYSVEELKDLGVLDIAKFTAIVKKERDD
jgi:hypothetical protein